MNRIIKNIKSNKWCPKRQLCRAYLLLLLVGLTTHVQAETSIGDTLKLSIEDAIVLAQKQSLSAIMAKNRLQTSYWDYKIFRADQLPEISFQGKLPTYRRQYNSYQHEDGSYSFVMNDNLSLSGGMSITQNLPFSGGKLTLKSALDFTRQMGRTTDNQFLSSPISLTLSQPIFGVNYMKWDRRIKPLRYEESKAEHLEQMENVTLSTIAKYFNYLLAQSSFLITKQNLENANKLYEVAQARRKIGQISQSELLQLKLTALQAKGSLTESQSTLKARMFEIRTFLGLEETQEISLIVPETLPASGLDYRIIYEKAMENNPFAKNILRRQLEADYSVATAKGNRRKINLYASFGNSGVNEELAGAYSNLANSQVVEFGVDIPILDWGKRKARVKMAESNRVVTESSIKQEKISFHQDIFLLVENFNNQAAQLEIALEADGLADMRYRTAMATFISGEINILDLNDARNSRDYSKQKLISEMYSYWNYYYNIQSVCLEKISELIVSDSQK